MADHRREWAEARDELSETLLELGFPEGLGKEIAKYLGSPGAIRRMTAYLGLVKPTEMEQVADEMIAIRTEIDAWRERKKSLEANAKYNEWLYSRPFEEDE